MEVKFACQACCEQAWNCENKKCIAIKIKTFWDKCHESDYLVTLQWQF